MLPAGVRVLRDGTAALVVHDVEPVLVVRIELGALAPTLTDGDILDRYEQRVLALGAALISAPQLRWDEARNRWRPSGRAIRCIVEGNDDPTIWIDEQGLTVTELGGMLSSHGAQVCLVFLDD